MNVEMLHGIDPVIAEHLERQTEGQLLDAVGAYRRFPSSEWETYSFFGVDEDMPEAVQIRRDAKQDFLAGHTRNPNIRYPKLSSDEAATDITVAEKGSIALQRRLDEVSLETDRVVVARELPEWQQFELGLLQIARAFEVGEVSEADKQDYVEMWDLLNQELFGPIDPGYFAGHFQPVRDFARDVFLTRRQAPAVVEEAAAYILGNTSDEVEWVEPKRAVEATPEELDSLRAMVEREFADLLSVVPNKPNGGALTFAEFVQMFDDAHAIRKTGWQTVVVPAWARVNTNQAKQQTEIGEERKIEDAQKSASILLHENGGHVARRVNGDLLDDPLLGGLGLVGYVDREEGFNKIVEQIYQGEQKAADEKCYVTIGLAQGLDGGTKRDFRDVFELEWRRNILKDYQKKGAVSEADVKSAREAAYGTCLRIFRGTPCDIPGMVYAKDLMYFNGTNAVWPTVKELAQMTPEEQHEAVQEILAAKYDFLNPVQKRVVQAARLAKQQRDAVDKSC